MIASVMLAALVWSAEGPVGPTTVSGAASSPPWTWQVAEDAGGAFSNGVFTAPERGTVRVFFNAGWIDGWLTNGWAWLNIRTNNSAACFQAVGLNPLSAVRHLQAYWQGRVEEGDTINLRVWSLHPSKWTGGPGVLITGGEFMADIQLVRLSDMNVGSDPVVVFLTFFGLAFVSKVVSRFGRWLVAAFKGRFGGGE